MDGRMQALAKAVEIAGSQAELARRLREIKQNPKIKQAHVWNWLNRDKQVPADMAIPIETAVADELTKEPRVTRHDLRPDLYPAPGPTQLELAT
jgi:DNA-binding transcriptional regulator YdaS (Cro superfamily)